MRHLVMGAAAAVGLSLAATQADAQYVGRGGLDVPSLVEKAACVVRRERVRRPNGAIVFRTVRRCGPGVGLGMGMSLGGCRTVRERIMRPNGREVVRVVRRCA